MTRPGAGESGFTGTEGLLQRAEQSWEQREKEASLRQAIESWELFLTQAGEDASTRIRLARAYHLLSRTVLLRRPPRARCDAPERDRRHGGELSEAGSSAGESSQPESPSSLGQPPVAEDEQAPEKESEPGNGEPSLPEDAARDEALRLLARGMESAEKALDALAPGLLGSLLAADPSAATTPELSEQALAALYWRTADLDEWSSLRGYAEAVARQQEILAGMNICLRRSPGFFHAGPHRYFGIHLARPLYPDDRDLEKSREHFEKALSLEPDFLENRLAYAKYYAVAAQDYRTFEEQLVRVLRAAREASGETGAENRLQQLEAENWLRRADELFE